MDCFCEIDYEKVTAWVAIFIALLSVYLSIRFHLIAIIYTQINIKAAECNSYIDKQNPEKLPQNEGQLSGIVSSIITMNELLDIELECKSFLLISKLKILRVFHLQLHTTMRSLLKLESDDNRIKQFMQNPDIEEQFSNCKRILNDQIEADKKN